MKIPGDQETLAGLKRKEQAAYQIIYQFYYPMVENFILRNNGKKEDAQDVFQETMIVLLRQVPKADFKLTSSLKTYVFAISSNLWLKRLRHAKRNVSLEWDELPNCLEKQPDDEMIAAENEATLSKKISRWFSQITVHCRLFLQSVFFLNKKSSDLGYKNPHSAQNQQYKCLQQLRKAAGTANDVLD